MQSATAMTTLQVSVSVEEPRREDWSELIREVERWMEWDSKCTAVGGVHLLANHSKGSLELPHGIMHLLLVPLLASFGCPL